MERPLYIHEDFDAHKVRAFQDKMEATLLFEEGVLSKMPLGVSSYRTGQHERIKAIEDVLSETKRYSYFLWKKRS